MLLEEVCKDAVAHSRGSEGVNLHVCKEEVEFEVQSCKMGESTAHGMA